MAESVQNYIELVKNNDSLTIHNERADNCAPELNHTCEFVAQALWKMISKEEEGYKTALKYVEGYLLPIILTIGIMGNILNIVILLHKRMSHNMNDLEKTSQIGLIALAISDLCYCITYFPRSFQYMERDKVQLYETYNFWMFYKTYREGITYTFVLVSTWITVLLALTRCIVICKPLHAREILSIKKMHAGIIFIYVTCALLCVPKYTVKSVVQFTCKTHGIGSPLPRKVYFSWQWAMSCLSFNKITYRTVLATFASVIPLIILLVTNALLIHALHKSYKMRRTHSNAQGRSKDSASNRLTPTLVTIIIIFIIMNMPVELSNFLLHGEFIHHNKHRYFPVMTAIFEVMQAINFTFNFLLYYIAIVPFRKTMHNAMAAMLCQRHQSENIPTQPPVPNADQYCSTTSWWCYE
ncbi:unnamed protein product [Owenia fusiformis]|uniref:G-protein coupled receptors family 1 profile domain-containing protein n=1 Tax=Owenia fusiformis TaxID=6347 RepID=A0A8S4NEQ3_OWEFU|nr:unnamed protein product [Owenia fusiformis]